ncbi:MAG: DMT family transporter [Opitutales bacterium]|nr:DMT family transporter [Opitutales bacterium]
MHAAVITAFLFALTGVCANQSSRLLGAGRANAWRLVVALVILGAWAHLFGSGFGGGVTRWFLLAGGIGFGLGGWCMFQALRRIGSTLALLMVECGAAVFAAAIGWVVLGAALRWEQMLFAGLILSGVIVGMTPGPIPNLTRSRVLAGCSLALAASLFQAISFNISRHAFNLLGEAEESIAFSSAAYQRLAGGLCVAVLLYGATVFIAGRRKSPPAPVEAHVSPLPASAWVAMNALFGPVLGVTCMLWAISLVENPGLVQSVAATATLLTVPFAFALEKARPGWTYYLGCLLALGGTAGLLFVRTG